MDCLRCEYYDYLRISCRVVPGGMVKPSVLGLFDVAVHWACSGVHRRADSHSCAGLIYYLLITHGELAVFESIVDESVLRYGD